MCMLVIAYLSKYMFMSVSACANFQKHHAHFSISNKSIMLLYRIHTLVWKMQHKGRANRLLQHKTKPNTVLVLGHTKITVFFIHKNIGSTPRKLSSTQQCVVYCQYSKETNVLLLPVPAYYYSCYTYVPLQQYTVMYVYM